MLTFQGLAKARTNSNFSSFPLLQPISYIHYCNCYLAFPGILLWSSLVSPSLPWSPLALVSHSLLWSPVALISPEPPETT